MFYELFLQFGAQTVVISKLNKAVSPPISIAIHWNVSLDCGENYKLQIGLTTSPSALNEHSEVMIMSNFIDSRIAFGFSDL
jgi:hypothetical protein